MKIKQTVYVTNPIRFAAKDYGRALTIGDAGVTIPGWIDCGEIELDINVDTQECRNIALDALEREEAAVKAELEGKLQLIEQQRAQLLCIEHDA